MELIIRPAPESVAAFDELFDRLEKLSDRLGPMLVNAALDFAHDVIADIFRGEGMSGIIGGQAWAPLAERTRRERAQLGFPSEHPILYRTGSLLDALVDEGSPGHVVERGRVGPGHYTGKLGTTDPRFEELQTGRDDMPARPMWPVGDAEMRFAAELGERLRRVVEENL